MTLAHFGLGVAVLGIVAMTAYRQELVTALKPQESASIAGAMVTFLGATPKTGPNFIADAGRYLVSVGGDEVVTLVSERRLFQPGSQSTTEVGIHSFLTGDLYVVMGEASSNGGTVVRLYFNPLVSLIWLGAALMFAGALVSLSDRRYRIGVPRLARRPIAEPAQ
jgi:cytochrome c-type biogenesis protein CcmF